MADSSIIARHSSSVPNSGQTVIDFGTTVQQLIFTVLTNDIFVEFNGSVNTDSFRIEAAQPSLVIDCKGSNVRYISIVSATGTANVYVLGIVA
jgi:hypothetical protein